MFIKKGPKVPCVFTPFMLYLNCKMENKEIIMKRKNLIIHCLAFVAIVLFPVQSIAQTMDIKGDLGEFRKVVTVEDMFKSAGSFSTALLKGDLGTVKYLVDTYPKSKLLTKSIQSNETQETQPICIAAEKGYTDIVKFIVSKDRKLVNADCQDKLQGEEDFSPKYKEPLWIAIRNGHQDTALYLISVDSSLNANKKYTLDSERPALLCAVATVFTDTKDLQLLVPALLRAGVNPNEATGYNNFRWSADAFLFAAKENNTNFITVLRDEMKNSGKSLVSYYFYWDYLSQEQDYAVADCPDLFPQEVSLLEKYGIESQCGYKFFDTGYHYEGD